MTSHFDDLNYCNDMRVRNAGKNKPPTVWIDDEEIELPWRWGVCPTCEGRGKHVNPSIDCNGLTSEDFAEDLEFAQDYMEGVYDLVCSQCNGRTTVAVVDNAALTPWQRQAYEAEQRDAAADHACRMAELRMGA